MKKILLILTIFYLSFTYFVNFASAAGAENAIGMEDIYEGTDKPGGCDVAKGLGIVSGDFSTLNSTLGSCIEGENAPIMSHTGMDRDPGVGITNLGSLIIKEINIFLFIVATGTIAWGAMLIVVSNGSEDKINKGKNIIKRTLIGFLALVSANGLIAILVDFLYGLS